MPLMVAGVLVAVGVAGYFYLAGSRYQSTDDAYVQAGQTFVSSSISGRVVAVDVKDNQQVKRGDELFHIETAPYRVAVEEAQARLANARLQVTAGKSSYQQQLATLRAAQESVTYAQREYDRQKSLLASGIASKAQFDQASHALQAAQQQVAAAQAQSAAALAMLGGNPDIDPEKHPSVMQAQAELDRAIAAWLDSSGSVGVPPED